MLVFNDLPNIGNLYLKKILFEFEGMPILFVCTGENKEYYLCLCTDSIIELKWLITKVNPSLLIELIEDKISVYNAFEKSNNEITIVQKKEVGFKARRYIFSDISEDELPDKNEKLENRHLDEFLEELRGRESVKLKIQFYDAPARESGYVTTAKGYTYRPVLWPIKSASRRQHIQRQMEFVKKDLEESWRKDLGFENITIAYGNNAIQKMKYNGNYCRPQRMAIRV